MTASSSSPYLKVIVFFYPGSTQPINYVATEDTTQDSSTTVILNALWNKKSITETRYKEIESAIQSAYWLDNKKTDSQTMAFQKLIKLKEKGLKQIVTSAYDEYMKTKEDYYLFNEENLNVEIKMIQITI